MLEKIKLALRIKNNATDDDIQDTIDAALFDLRVSGVVNLDESDPLIIQAVKLYCKANYGLDNKYLFIYSDFTNNNVKAKFFFYYICKEKEFSKGKNEKDTFNLKDDIQNECSFKNDYTSKIIFTSLPTGLKLKYKLYGSFVDIEPNSTSIFASNKEEKNPFGFWLDIIEFGNNVRRPK